MPAELETATRDAAVATLVAVTVAPGTCAPAASVTVPVICPAPTCARAVPPPATSMHTATRISVGRIPQILRATNSRSNLDVIQIDLTRLLTSSIRRHDHAQHPPRLRQ